MRVWASRPGYFYTLFHMHFYSVGGILQISLQVCIYNNEMLDTAPKTIIFINFNRKIDIEG